MGRALRDPVRDLAVQRLLLADLRRRAAFPHLRLPQLLQAFARTLMAGVRALLSAVRRADPRRLRRRRWSDRQRGVRRTRMGRHRGADGGNRRRRGVRQQGRRAAVPRRLLPALRSLRAVHRARAGEVRRPHSGRVRGVSANLGLGAERPHLFRLQHHRRGGDPAGPAPPHQRPRRGGCRSHFRAADDASGAAVLHSDGRFLSRGSKRHPPLRLSAAADRHSRPSTCCSRR